MLHITSRKASKSNSNFKSDKAIEVSKSRDADETEFKDLMMQTTFDTTIPSVNHDQNNDVETNINSLDLNIPQTENWRSSLKDLKAHFFSVLYLPMIPFFIFTMIRALFIVPSTKDLLLPDVYAANKMIQIFSFLPCPVLGWVADRIGIIWVMHFCNVCGALSVIFVMIPGIILQYLSSIFFAVMVSFLCSQIYCYIAAIFPQKHMGTLTGTLCAIAGLISFATIPMNSYAKNNSYSPMLALLLVFSATNALILVFLQLKKKKLSPHQRKS